jgi:hypothetical protein
VVRWRWPGWRRLRNVMMGGKRDAVHYYYHCKSCIQTEVVRSGSSRPRITEHARTSLPLPALSLLHECPLRVRSRSIVLRFTPCFVLRSETSVFCETSRELTEQTRDGLPPAQSPPQARKCQDSLCSPLLLAGPVSRKYPTPAQLSAHNALTISRKVSEAYGHTHPSPIPSHSPL